MACNANVVLPLDSGPNISITRPRGKPPTPSAASNESEPDEMASSAAVLSSPPSRIIEPLPNCFSICDTARSRARDFSVRSSAIRFLSISDFGLRNSDLGNQSPCRWLPKSEIRNPQSEILFVPFRTQTPHQAEFVADKSIKLIRAGRILGKTAHAPAIACFPWIQGLSGLKTLLGLSQPVHLQAQQTELVMGFAEFRIQFRGLLQVLDGAFVL